MKGVFFLYEKVAFKSTSAEPLPRWAIGTGQSSCLQFRSGTIARRGRGGIMPFGSASTTLYLLWVIRKAVSKSRQQSPQRAPDPAHSDPKAISPFALPIVKKRRLFEDKPGRSSCALERQGKWAADGHGPSFMELKASFIQLQRWFALFDQVAPGNGYIFLKTVNWKMKHAELKQNSSKSASTQNHPLPRCLGSFPPKAEC